MDLSTVENKLRSNQYTSVNMFAADIRKIWNNAFMYNMKGSPIYLMTAEMNNYFEKLIHDIENVTFSHTVRDLEKKVEMLSKQITEITELHQRGISQFPENPKLSRSNTKSSSRSSKLLDKPLSFQEKKTLGQISTSFPQITSVVSGILSAHLLHPQPVKKSLSLILIAFQ